MALADEIETRLGTQLLVRMTNRDDATAVTIDAAVLAAAIADVTGDFAMSGITLDASEASHVLVATDGVVWRLAYYGAPSAEGATRYEERYRKGLDRLRLVTSRDRILPVTDGELDPSEDKPPGVTGTVRPSFDREVMGGVVPRQPRGRYPYRRGYPSEF